MSVPCQRMVANIAPVASGPVLGAPAPTEANPLPSWNEGSAKEAIRAFVRATTD